MSPGTTGTSIPPGRTRCSAAGETAAPPVGYLVPRSADDLVPHGQVLLGDDLPQRRQHHPHAGLRPSDRARRPACGQSATRCRPSRSPMPRPIARRSRAPAASSPSPRAPRPIGYRLREDPAERAALRIVGRSEAGVVMRGKIGMHTSPAFAEDVYIGAVNGVDLDGQRATFVVPVECARRDGDLPQAPRRAIANPFSAPLSSRFDELDGQMWLDDVVVPWDRVFLTEPSPEPVARWLFWHQLYCWLAKAEFTLGLALACTHAMGLGRARADHRVPARPDHRRADRAQLPDRRRARPGDYRRRLLLAQPRPSRRRQHRDAEGAAAHGRDPAHPARLLAGRGAVRQGSRRRRRWPAAWRSRSPAAATARCSARRCCRWRGTMSARRSTIASMSSSCMPMAANSSWRGRLRRASTATTSWPTRVLQRLDVPMPAVNLDSIRNAPLAARRPVSPMARQST